MIERYIDEFIMKVEPEWKLLHKVADRHVKKIEKIIMTAFRKMKAGINAKNLSYVSLESINDHIDYSVFVEECEPLYEALAIVMIEGGQVAANHLKKRREMKLISPVKKDITGNNLSSGELLLMESFNMRNQKAIEWAEKNTGKLITGIDETTRNGIAQIIANAQRYGGHPYETALEIQEMIGLTDRQIIYIKNLEQQMIESGKTKEYIASVVKAYTSKKTLERAKMIARTETIASSCQGQQLHWEDQLEKGFLDNFTMQKEWIVTPDDRLCPICAAMNKERTSIDGFFNFGGKTPPRHPRCRCAVGLVETAGLEIDRYIESTEGKDWGYVDNLLGL